MVSTNVLGRGWAGELIGIPIAAHPDVFSCWISIRVGQAWYEPYPYISNFEVIIFPNVTTQIIHEIDVMVI